MATFLTPGHLEACLLIPPVCLPLNRLVSDLLSLYYEMERSESKLSKLVRRVFRPLAGCETRDLVHTSPAKSRAKKWASKSLRIFSGAFSPSNDVKDDDASSFMSPMPDEMFSPPTEDKCPLSSFSSKDTSDWSGDDSDSVRLSFIHCADIIDCFPGTPVISKSEALHLRHPRLSRPPTLFALSHDFSNQMEKIYGTNHRREDSSGRALKRVNGRSSMPFTLLSSQVSSQYSPPSMPFDMLTRTRHLCSDSLPSHCESDLDASPPDSFYSLSIGSASAQNSQQSLGSPLLLSPSFTMPSRPNASSSSNLIPNHLATDASLQDLSEPTPSLCSSPSSPSSLRSVMSRVPGLERRVSGSPRRRFNPIHGSANPGEGHVPYGTIPF